MLKDQIATSVHMETDLDYTPFDAKGGRENVLFGDEMKRLLTN